MIPFAIGAVLITKKDNSVVEAGLTDCNAEGFSFRLSEKLDYGEIDSVCLKLFAWEADQFSSLEFGAEGLKTVEQNDFFWVYRVEETGDEYEALVRDFWKQYSQYVKWKKEGSPEQLSHFLTGYPEGEEDNFAPDFSEQKKAWSREILSNCHWDNADLEGMELALSVDSLDMLERYLQLPMEAFFRERLEGSFLTEHPISGMRPKGIFIGNSFCAHQLPTLDKILATYEKAEREGICVTLCLPCMQESYLQDRMTLIEKLWGFLERKNATMEVVVNDWGTMELLKEKTTRLIPVLGVLLNKRRKDPRMKYQREYSRSQKAPFGNALSLEAYRRRRKEEGIEIYSWEADGGTPDLPMGINILQIPYYQTNTSQMCPLYAVCKEGNRGIQYEVENCPEFCKEYVLLYPKHLHLIGRFNSLFGMALETLQDSAFLKAYKESGLKRIVLTLW